MALSLAFFVACGGTEEGLRSGSPRHVVLISLDTTRADRLSPWGGEPELTPRLAALASESVVFLQASSPAPTTLAAHTSLLTGTPPRAHGVARNGFMVHPENVTMAEVLGEAGLQTLAVIGSFALESVFGLDQGFARYDEEFGLEYKPGLYDQNQRRAAEVTSRSLKLIDEAMSEGSSQGLFLFAHYFDPHAPYDPPDWALEERGLEVGERADLKEIAGVVMDQQERAAGVRLGPRWAFSNGLRAELLDGADGVATPGGERLARLYDAEVRYLDAELGRLLDGLAERGVLNDALLIITGDHGETFWEHGDFWNHGLGVYQTTLHVPLLIRMPGGGSGGRRISQPVSTLSVLPTVCGFLGLTQPEAAGGVDLIPAIGGRDLSPDWVVISEATQPVGEIERDQEWPNALKAKAVRRGRWKYILTPYLGNREELYDLIEDPGEQDNLLEAGDIDAMESASELRGELLRWTETHSPLPSRFNSAQADSILERLEALGYAGEDD
ncbi:MAG: sulfatase-like hydrolase/transferase [Planctomycetes bacterium]|nr:sulfatase-like hydrolase/transferase [Planctomycetota bacterium]